MKRVKRFFIRIYEDHYLTIRRWIIRFRYRFSVMSMDDTVEYICKTGCSIARFGDGEFGLIIGGKKPSFQEDDKDLTERLQEVCVCSDDRLLVCIPHSFKTTDDCCEFARKFWEWWLWDDDRFEKVAKCLHLNPWRRRNFGDAHITRPYMDWTDKSKAAYRFQHLMQLWEFRDVVIIEGNQTRLGVGNDLLNKTRSVRRILCPAKNAFNRYNEILDAARTFEKNILFLIALYLLV